MRYWNRHSVYRLGATVLLALAPIGVLPSQVQASEAYPQRAPISQYLEETDDAEIAMARTAAPAAIADKADVMVLGKTGYRTAIKGSNGFVCMVWRSWSDDLADAQFWNPKVRAPICLNAVAVRTVLPGYLKRTDWVFSGLTLVQMQSRFHDAAARGELLPPAPGAMSYMMAREGFLADGIGHAAPHIMFFVPRTDQQEWGANLAGSPIFGAQSADDPVALFFVSVPRWSDGTPAMAH